MNSKLLSSPEFLHQCPRCDRQALARIDNTKYRCLWCGFYRDLAEPYFNSFGGLGLLVVLLVVIVVFLGNG